MHRRLSRALTTIIEHGCVSYAKMATMGGFGDLYCIITKATPPDDSLVSDRYINQLLKLFSLSPTSSFRSFSLCFSRRFTKTRSWKVALKCLILLHRLLRTLPEHSPFREEITWARSKGLLFLNPCMFVDSSSSSFPEDYVLFIRSYARLLDEAIDCYSIYIDENEERGAEDNFSQETLAEKIKEETQNPGKLIELLPQLQSLIDRVLDCQPTPMAIPNNLVQSALTLIIQDSFICYTCFRRHLDDVLEILLQLPYRSCTFAFIIYKKAAMQTNKLSEFYNWCKHMAIFCEYPCVDKIPELQIIAIEKLVNNMWELTESSPPSSTLSPSTGSCWSLIEDGSEKNVAHVKTIVSNVWEKFEDDVSLKEVKKSDEMDLIRFEEVGNNLNWLAILEGSLLPTHEGCENDTKYTSVPGQNSNEIYIEGTNESQMQVYNPNHCLNHVYHENRISQEYRASSTDPEYPWGL